MQVGLKGGAGLLKVVEGIGKRLGRNGRRDRIGHRKKMNWGKNKRRPLLLPGDRVGHATSERKVGIIWEKQGFRAFFGMG